jgi:hypothetical protein
MRMETDVARMGKMAVDAGVEERRIRMAEQIAEQLVSVLRGVVTELGHNPADPKVAGVVQRHLQLVRKAGVMSDTTAVQDFVRSQSEFAGTVVSGWSLGFEVNGAGSTGMWWDTQYATGPSTSPAAGIGIVHLAEAKMLSDLVGDDDPDD